MLPTRELVDRFLAAKMAKGLRPKTLTGYASGLNRFARMYPDLPEDPCEIESFLLDTGPTLETRDTYYRLLRNFYRWLMARQRIVTNPMILVEAPRLKPKVPRGLTPDELYQLLSFPGHTPRRRAFLHLMADTGLRLGEALSVEEDKVGERTVHVDGKVGEREVPISPDIRRMVLATLPWPWKNANNASKAVRRAFEAAGIIGKRASAQTLRHTFVRLWSGDESILVSIMGWTTPRMLLHYRPYDIDRAAEEHRHHSPLCRLPRQLSLSNLF